MLRTFVCVFGAGVLGLVAWADRVEAPAPAGPTTLIVVRHADRDGDRDALTEAGVARARELARVVAKAGVAGVYCTKTERTRATVEPLAKALGITPVELAPADVDGLLAHVFRHHAGKTVVIAGHSNTVPRIIAAAGGPKLDDLAETEFDDLFVLCAREPGDKGAALARLQYGAASP